jgi:hypothetical protein
MLLAHEEKYLASYFDKVTEKSSEWRGFFDFVISTIARKTILLLMMVFFGIGVFIFQFFRGKK